MASMATPSELFGSLRLKTCVSSSVLSQSQLISAKTDRSTNHALGGEDRAMWHHVHHSLVLID